ncbi:hypothetical protein [Acinetobacter sp. ANC 3882]|uniref:hypothetical protein n=1 Tax=Acinetobacter sp. ANC 3882 TaxID=2923423 RepID=UPI001F4A8B57|nr:hypothetical protein [Acinetobacter sp. ANC 3882]MCH7313132.1 hypothetical protein [Acinetobacter sp. ANC 3882]
MNRHKGDTVLSQGLSSVLTSLLWMKQMLNKTKRWLACLYVFPILFALTACNDSSDDQTAVKPDDTKKPVMRCAP